MEIHKEKINVVSATAVNERTVGAQINRLQRINDFAKPGNYYELCIDEVGIEWANVYGDADTPVRVEFDPASSKIVIRVPEHFQVTVEKVTKI